MPSDTDISALYPESSRIRVSRDSDTVRSDDEDAIQPGGWSPLLVLAGATCCLGSALPAGFNIGVINTPANLIKDFCNQSLEERYRIQVSEEGLNILWSAIVSIFLIGGVSGSLTAGLLADKLGRKGTLAIGNLCGVIGALLFFLTPILNSVELLLAGRLIVGLSGGLATSLLPMYMTELAPLRLRGAVGVLCQLGITTGVLLGQIVGLDTILGTEKLWSYMLAAFLPLCVLALPLTLVLPESPKFLYVIKEQHETAITELSRLRNMDVILLRNEVLVLEQELTLRTSSDNWTISRVLNDHCLRLPLVLVILMQFGQQLSGINAVFYYSDSIFEKAGLDKTSSQYATIGTGLANVFMALVSVLLMSRVGRRSLLLSSCYLSACCLLVLCFAIAFIHSSKYVPWLCILAVQAYVIFYGLGLGPIPFFIGSELFDVGPRPAAMALGSVANWGGNFVVGMTFTALQNLIGSYTFLIFILCILALSGFVRTYLPETRGKSTSEISSIMTQGFKSRPNRVLNTYDQ
ncbi:solute carrier family 2, facilitated glucose transporter member 1-like isoform X2 [Belonocnema kinseyi]|uniref:solute carrier family 2, facilitated glucose transporter member 1-like isoform X2 n=1 Tax=Belonocnema kinseyi TaxID=2817044 RepID=UPI00143D3D8B|nr:solute carrier family 2, facilitated glucose transporter member 1-like isoform X2 [Belonocnema kinseyi]